MTITAHWRARTTVRDGHAKRYLTLKSGTLLIGLAALTYQRAFPRRRSAEHPAR